MKAAVFSAVLLATAAVGTARPASPAAAAAPAVELKCDWANLCIYKEGANCGPGFATELASTLVEAQKKEQPYKDKGYDIRTWFVNDCKPGESMKMMCCPVAESSDCDGVAGGIGIGIGIRL